METKRPNSYPLSLFTRQLDVFARKLTSACTGSRRVRACKLCEFTKEANSKEFAFDCIFLSVSLRDSSPASSPILLCKTVPLPLPHPPKLVEFLSPFPRGEGSLRHRGVWCKLTSGRIFTLLGSFAEINFGKDLYDM